MFRVLLITVIGGFLLLLFLFAFALWYGRSIWFGKDNIPAGALVIVPLGKSTNESGQVECVIALTNRWNRSMHCVVGNVEYLTNNHVTTTVTTNFMSLTFVDLPPQSGTNVLVAQPSEAVPWMVRVMAERAVGGFEQGTRQTLANVKVHWDYPTWAEVASFDLEQ